jgi:hypothetical protein
MTTRNVLIVLLCLAPAALVAQATLYRRSTADTLRYRESTIFESATVSSQGENKVTTSHNALLSVAVIGGDSVHAWYDSLVLRSEAPGRDMRPGTLAVLRQPFVLRLDARGRVTTRDVPTFPTNFREVSDLSHQFDDFFVRLPGTPLRIGSRWTDTVVLRSKSGLNERRTRSINTYRVARDTTVHGIEAVVIAEEQQLEFGGTIADADRSLTTSSILAGTSRGYVVFSLTQGRQLARVRTGEMSGKLAVRAASRRLDLTVTSRFRSTMNDASLPAPPPD